MRRLHDLVQPAQLFTYFGNVRRRTRAPGVDNITPDAYGQTIEGRIARLSAALLDESWKPSRLMRLRRAKPGGGFRVLSIPTVEDRIVIEMLRDALEPTVERQIHPAAFAYRPGRSARTAVDVVATAIERGAMWVAIADVRDFFDTVRLRPILDTLEEFACDPALVRLLDKILTNHAFQPGRGLAQGSSLSPLLSNVAMIPFDRHLRTAGFDLVRYCDNLCIPTASKEVAEHALSVMHREAKQLGLSFKSDASRVAAIEQGFLWLGFWLGKHGRRVSDGALQALVLRANAAGQNVAGHMLRNRLEPIVRGWAQYFEATIPAEFHFGPHDALIRELIAAYSLVATTNSETIPPMETSVEPLVEIEMEEDPWSWESSGPVNDAETTASSTADVLLQDADRLATAGHFMAAQEKWEAAQRIDDGAASTHDLAQSVEPIWDEEWLDIFIGLFGAGQESFDIMTAGDAGRRKATPTARPVAAADVRAHLIGRGSIAINPRLSDGSCLLGVIDIDARTTPPNPDVAVFAHRLCHIARAWQWDPLLETTGGRGFHLWFPLTSRGNADGVYAALASLVRIAGPLPEGTHCEILPAPTNAPDLHGQTMTLPLGLHVETSVRSRLYLSDGLEVSFGLSELARAITTAPERLETAIGFFPQTQESTKANTATTNTNVNPLPVWSQYGRSVERVMTGCAILRHLAEKARDLGHLNHGERLSLLYSLGHLDAPGAQAIHAVICPCGNYDAAETSRQIENRRGLPVSCTRLREKHATPELLPMCQCDFGDMRHRGGYATPLLHAGAFRREWRGVLRERRDAEASLKKEVNVGVRVKAENSNEEGVVLRALPPHEWA